MPSQEVAQAQARSGHVHELRPVNLTVERAPSPGSVTVAPAFYPDGVPPRSHGDGRFHQRWAGLSVPRHAAAPKGSGTAPVHWPIPRAA